jgi:hypothetical protein
MSKPVAWQWLDVSIFRKSKPRYSYDSEWRPLYTTPPDHREAMRQAIEALRDAHAYSVMHEEFRDGVLDVIDALRAALGEQDD